ncbi:MAG: hypothetical protein ALAOOOJD_04136 [bacterium]|nr:hypothetical protein [bacterium]
MIRATQFYQEMRRGSSLPLLIGGNDGKRYVVKLNGAGDGVLSNITEWIANKLGGFLQIPVLPLAGIFIDADFAAQAKDPETRELLERSAGLNLGTLYLPDATAYQARLASRFADSLRQQIFFFDVIFLNIDRTDTNPNMIIHGDKLWCLDFSSAMEIRSLITGEPYREHVLLKQLKHHPFYGENLNAYGFIKQLREIPDEAIREIVGTIPRAWLGHLRVSRNVIIEKLLFFKQQGITLRNRLDLLRALKIETAEEARLRSRQNRQAFEQKYGKL